MAGKELSDALSESSFAASSFKLLDEDRVNGQIASAGDEISFIQKIDASSFEGMDLVFFAGDPEVAKKFWKSARQAGAAIIDLTSGLEAEEGVLIRSPWIAAARSKSPGGTVSAELNLETSVVVAAHPASVMLGVIAAKLAVKFTVKSFAATLLEPASQYGRAAMDELHQQTVSLLSFQAVPREQYDAQVAFNLLRGLGDEAKIKLEDTERRVEVQYSGLLGSENRLELQLIHAPVFHGYVASVFVELAEAKSAEEVEMSLVGDHIDLVATDSEPPSNLSATGQEDVIVWVDARGKTPSTRFKLLLAADNLKLAAANSIACARELAQLRPLGKVQ